jgi:hypothetical protein
MRLMHEGCGHCSVLVFSAVTGKGSGRGTTRERSRKFSAKLSLTHYASVATQLIFASIICI